MILDSFILDGMMSKKQQMSEIIRIKNAPVGTILYTEKLDSDRIEVIETLLSKSDVSWISSLEGVYILYIKR